MSTSSPPSDVRNLTCGQKCKLASIIGFSIAAGIGLAMSPPWIENLGTAILGVMLTTSGAISAGAGAFIYRRSGKLLLCVLFGILSILLALLALPAWTRLLSIVLPA